MYDYREAMTEDVKEWIKENVDLTEWTEDREGLEQQLNDDLWTEDSITGNASGSYYCKPKCFKLHGTRKGYAYLRLT